MIIRLSARGEPATMRRIYIPLCVAACVLLGACSRTSIQESTAQPYVAAAAAPAKSALTVSFVMDADLDMNPQSPTVTAPSTIAAYERELGTASDGGYAAYPAQQ